LCAGLGLHVITHVHWGATIMCRCADTQRLVTVSVHQLVNTVRDLVLYKRSFVPKRGELRHGVTEWVLLWVKPRTKSPIVAKSWSGERQASYFLSRVSCSLIYLINNIASGLFFVYFALGCIESNKLQSPPFKLAEVPISDFIVLPNFFWPKKNLRYIYILFFIKNAKMKEIVTYKLSITNRQTMILVFRNWLGFHTS
jgi:hypothetical protein